MSDDQFLRQFYDILGQTEGTRPPVEAWLAFARENAQLWPIECDGKMVGGVLWKGHTVHIAVLPEYHGRWLRRSHLRAWRQMQFPVDVYATPAADNAAACELARRLGFREQGRAGQSIIFIKERSCPQP
jgi:RimJ/RimL family protein N-acetyltransferase